MTLDRTQPPALHRDLDVEIPFSVYERHSYGTIATFPNDTLEVISLTFILPKEVARDSSLLDTAVAAMLLRGTRKKKAEELAMALESSGVRLSVVSLADVYELRVRFAKKKLSRALKLLEEIFLTATFPEEEVAQWLAAEKERFKSLVEDPEFLAQQALMPHLFGREHPYGSVVRLEDFAQVTAQQIRDRWASSLRHQIVVVAAGGLSVKDVRRLDASLAVCFPHPVHPVQRLYPDCPRQEQKLLYTPCSNAAQVAILGGMCFPPRTEETDDFTLDVALALLGGVFRSRLMLNLREDKGYTYGVRLRLAERQAVSFVSIQTTVGKAYAREALKEIRHEFERLQAEPPSQEEVDGLRTELLVSLMEQLDNTLQAARVLTDARLEEVDASARMRIKIDTIRTITPEQIWRVAQKKLFFTNFVWSIAGGEPLDTLP